MANAFIIMQIGNADLDRVCADCIVPAIEACGLSARRVDKHNTGGLLKSEIIRFIESAQIIIADLTNERPNCYLEVGYAMGLDKFQNLVLTAREDHYVESPNHKPGDPKIHFDISGYDILFWHPEKLVDFRSELEKRIRRRLAILEPSGSAPEEPWDSAWISSHQSRALAGLSKLHLTGYMEVRFALERPKSDWSQKLLDEAVRTSNIRTFGWPIAVHLGNRDEYRPHPRADGIVAEISIDDRPTYDYWTLKRNGDFYLLHSLFEDTRDRAKLFFDTRIIRVTETFLFCVRLYSRLGVDPATKVAVAIRHGGFKDRVLGVANQMRIMPDRDVAAEDESMTEMSVALGAIDGHLVELVKQVCAPLFMLFNYTEFEDRLYEEIVNAFVKGRTG
jgi:hypothetical protein